MKIPKKIKAFGYTFKIKIVNKKETKGGAFKFSERLIELSNDTREQENIFLHELLEMIMVELGYRFYPQENSMEFIFMFDHSGFVRIHSMLYQILKDNKMI